MITYVHKSVTFRSRLKGFQRDIWLLIALTSVMLSYTLVTFLAFVDNRVEPNIWVIVTIHVCDLIYFVDVCWRIKSYHHLKRKVSMTKKGRACRIFIFIMDCVSMLPLEGVVFIKSLTLDIQLLEVFALLRLNRVLRLYRISKYYSGKIKELRLNLYRRELFALFICFLCFLITLFHGVACLWYRLSCRPICKNKPPTCDSTELDHPHYAHIQRDVDVGDSFGWYVAALHWAAISLRNCGNRYIPPNEREKMIVSSVIMFFGYTMCMVITAVLVYVLSEMDLLRSIFFHEAYAVKSFVKHFDMAKNVATFSDSCFNFMWKRRRGYSDHSMKQILPKSVQTEIGMCMIQPMVDSSEILRHFPLDALESISLSACLKHFFPNEFLIRPNTMAYTAFYIISGKVEVLSDIDGITPIVVLSNGSLIAEINLLYPSIRKNGVKTRTPCDIIMLNSSNISELLVEYPQVERKVRAIVRNRVNWIQAKGKANKEIDSPPDKKSRVLRFEADSSGTNINETSTAKSEQNTAAELNNLQKLKKNEMSHPTNSKTSRATGTQFMSVLAWLTFTKEQRERSTCTENAVVYEHLHHKFRNQASTRMYMFSDLDVDPNYYWKRCLVSKSSVFYRIWEVLVLAVIIFNAFVYPLELIYSTTSISYPIDATVDVVYLLDLLLRLFICVEPEDLTPNATVWSHFKQQLVNPLILFDLIPVIPLHFLYSVTGLTFRQRNGIRFLVSVKFMRLVLFFTKLENDVRVRIFTIRFVKNFVYISIYIFWLAGFFCILGCPDYPDCSNSTETWPNRKLKAYKFDNSQDSVFLLSLYWAICTTFGIGFNDIILKTKSESGIASVGLLLSFCLLSYFYADLTSTLSGTVENAIHHQDNVIWLTRYLDEALIDLRLIDRVTLYLNVQWQALRGISSESHRSIGFLTVFHSMYIELVVDYVADYLYRTHLFKHLDTDTMRKFCLSAKLAVVPPNETIVKYGDFLRRMYVIRRGFVQVFLGNSNTTVAILSSGHSFGEINMLFGFPSHITLVSMTYLEIIVLDNATFERILPSAKFFNEAIDALKNDMEGLLEYQKKSTALRVGGGSKVRFNRRNRASSQLHDTSTFVYRKTMKNSKGQIIYLNRLGADPYTREFQNRFCGRCLRYLLMPLSFLPKGQFIRCWELTRVLLIIVCAILIPLVEAFPVFKNDIEHFIISFDVISAIDMFIRCHTAYYISGTNELVTHPVLALRNYLSTSFFVDFLASYPVYAAVNYSIKDTEYESTVWGFLLKCNRLIMIYRVYRYYRYQDCKIVKGKNTWKIFKLLPILFYQTHFLACVAAVATCPATQSVPIPTPRCRNESWMSVSVANGPIRNQTLSEDVIYTIAFYYIATSSMSCGFGDYHPYNESERTTISLLFFFYIFTKAFILANIVGSKCHLDHKLLGYQKQMNYLIGFIGREKLDNRLTGRIIRYYDYQWRRTQGIEPQKLFANLFPSLRKEVAMDVFEDVMRQLPAFKRVPPSFLRTICVYLTPIYFLRHDVIVQKGDVCDHIYFISRGKVLEWREEGEVNLDVGDYIGSLDVDSVRPTYSYTASALTNVDIFGIRRKDFVRTVNFYPDITKRFFDEHHQSLVTSNSVSYSQSKEFLVGVNLNETKNINVEDEPNQKNRSMLVWRQSLSQIVTLITKQDKHDGKVISEDRMYYSVLPESPVHRYLDFATFTAAVFSTTLATYQWSFEDHSEWAFVIGYIMDAVYIVKMGLSFRVSYFDESGEIISDVSEIQNKYLSDYHGFALHFVSTFPFEIFVGASAAASANREKLMSTWVFLRMNRVLRLVHVWTFFEKRTNSLVRNLLRTKLERVTCFTIMYLHFLACILQGFSTMGAYTPTKNCIKPTNNTEQIRKWACEKPERWFQTKDSKSYEPYTWSMYFILSTFTTTAYGDLLPVTIFEMILISLTAFSSVLWFGLVLSDILSGLQNTIDTSYHLAADVVLKLYKDNGVAPNSLRKVGQYFTYAWAENNGVVVPEFLIRAPACLRMDIYTTCYGAHFRSSYLFQHLPEDFIRQAAIRIRNFWVLAGDYVVRQNEIDSHMYFIHRGYIEYTQESFDNDRSVTDLGYLGKSALFGEIQCILSKEPHKYSYKAQVNLDVISLTPADIQELFELFPQHKQTLIDRVSKRQKEGPAPTISKQVILEETKSMNLLKQWRLQKAMAEQTLDLYGEMDEYFALD
ncbi:unnamed protein product [Allacma fusca]|uniref:Cyclic nucleotide-binding domain-containing protein n=1 Tax=Allacma fusca TaxID=39272 RepID=A0A8J2LJT0_9HEXA|nr:unnamed protein product [Allacma fusca]